jgi:gluconolactonase
MIPGSLNAIMKTALYSVLATAVLSAACSTHDAAKAPGETKEAPKGVGTILRLDPDFDAIAPKDAVIEKLADGFQFTEGPVWRPDGQKLWFSDVQGNVIRQYTPADSQIKVILENAGGTGGVPGGFIGPNGEIAGKDGAVLVCQHTARRIIRIAKDMNVAPLVDKFEGKRFNSPNDLVYKSDGSLYFTDPPYGLPKQDDDPGKELKFNGVFRLENGKLTVIVRDLTRPNGIAFSPDEKTLYIANSDEKRKIWMAYDVHPDGTVKNGRVFFDVTAEKEEGLPDGMKVDAGGNVYGTGPGGVWVFSASGKHIGTIKPPETPANCNWGDDGKSLYMTARTGLYRIKLAASGGKTLFQ